MIIGIDIDNVLCDTTGSVLKIHEIDTGEHLEISDIKTYYIENFVGEKYQNDFHKIFLDKKVWKSIKLIPNCVKYIEMLNNDGHEIYFVTKTESANIHKKEMWLKRNFPFINVRKRLICIPNKQLLSGLDILVDDCLDNLIGGDYNKVVLDYPWNRSVDNKEGILRCSNWEEIYNTVENIENANAIYSG